MPWSFGIKAGKTSTARHSLTVGGADLEGASLVLAQLFAWIEDYNARTPRSALGMRSPAEYRAQPKVSSSSVQ